MTDQAEELLCCFNADTTLADATDLITDGGFTITEEVTEGPAGTPLPDEEVHEVQPIDVHVSVEDIKLDSDDEKDQEGAGNGEEGKENEPDESTISNNDKEQVISVTPIPAQDTEDKILNKALSEEEIINKAPSIDDLKTLDEKSLVSEVNLAAQPPRYASTSMSGFLETEEMGLGGEAKDDFVVLGDVNQKGEEELRNLVKDHEKRLSCASISKLSSGDKAKLRIVSDKNLKTLQKEVEKLKEIDPDYLKTLNRHNDTVQVNFTSYISTINTNHCHNTGHIIYHIELVVYSFLNLNFHSCLNFQREEEKRKKKKKKKEGDNIKPGEDRTVKKSKRVFIEGDKEVIVTITEETVVRPIKKGKKSKNRKKVRKTFSKVIHR